MSEELTHEEKMAALADDDGVVINGQNAIPGVESKDEPPAEPPADDKPARPDHIPEKFWNAETGEVNVEALLKSQRDAEEALRKAQAGKSDDKSDDAADDEPPASATDAVNKASAEWAEKGELSDETYASLEKAGLDRATVDSFIAGQEAIASRLQEAAFSNFEKGKEGFEAARDWAVENLSEGDIKALDAQLTSGDPMVVAAGAKALADRYASEADIEPGVVVKGGVAPSVGEHYKSAAEMTAAMADSRYKTDPAYRKEVEGKIDRAEKAGIDLFS